MLLAQVLSMLSLGAPAGRIGASVRDRMSESGHLREQRLFGVPPHRSHQRRDSCEETRRAIPGNPEALFMPAAGTCPGPFALIPCIEVGLSYGLS